MKKRKSQSMPKIDLASKLSPIQYAVTQHSATEPPFANLYWNNRKPGIYLDIITKKPIFTTLDQFDSGCGWPSFSKSLVKLVEKSDLSHQMIRTEVRNQEDTSHLGHLFDDGPESLGGMRYCINSAALEFVPLEDMEKAGYGDYIKLFKEEGK